VGNIPSITEFGTGLNVLIAINAIAAIGLGANWVVDSAARIAKKLGVSELVIGLTVVAFGTSAPEFAVTLIAAFRHQGDISVGNIVGSNIFNLGFILGGCALVRSIPIERVLLKRDGAVIGTTTLLLLLLVGWDLRLDRYDGILLATLLVIYLGYLFKHRRDTEQSIADSGNGTEKTSLARDSALLIVGLIFIVGGSQVLVEAATTLARNLGISEWVISVTIVAAGTSAPEFATSLAGVIKGRYAMSAGNVIGSDIFNLLGVLGLAGILRPIEVSNSATISLIALSIMVLFVLLFMRTGWRISRKEGLILVILSALRWGYDISSM